MAFGLCDERRNSPPTPRVSPSPRTAVGTALILSVLSGSQLSLTMIFALPGAAPPCTDPAPRTRRARVREAPGRPICCAARELC